MRNYKELKELNKLKKEILKVYRKKGFRVSGSAFNPFVSKKK